jgi:hypothetical protein
MQFSDGFHSDCTSDFVQIETIDMDILAMIRRMFREESMSHTWVLERKFPNSWRPNKARQMKSKGKSMFIILFDMKGNFHTEFVLPGHTVNKARYCGILW